AEGEACRGGWGAWRGGAACAACGAASRAVSGAEAPARRRARSWRACSRSSAVRSGAGRCRLGRGTWRTLTRARGEPAFEQVRRGARVLAGFEVARRALGDAGGEALVVHLNGHGVAQEARQALREVTRLARLRGV